MAEVVRELLPVLILVGVAVLLMACLVVGVFVIVLRDVRAHRRRVRNIRRGVDARLRAPPPRRFRL